MEIYDVCHIEYELRINYFNSQLEFLGTKNSTSFMYLLDLILVRVVIVMFKDSSTKYHDCK